MIPFSTLPYRVGITGGIGSGKSVLSNLLRVMDVPVYDCDTEAKSLMNEDENLRESLIGLVGEQVYDGEGLLNRPFLAKYMFGYPERVAAVNGLVHPVVRTHFASWASRQQVPLVAVESAILFESHLDEDVNEVWLVSAPESVRLHRAVARDASDEVAIRRRMQQQLSDAELRRRVQTVFLNDGTTPLIPQLQSWLTAFYTRSSSLL